MDDVFKPVGQHNTITRRNIFGEIISVFAKNYSRTELSFLYSTNYIPANIYMLKVKNRYTRKSVKYVQS